MPRTQQRRKHAGVTLIELLVALALVGVVLAAAGSMLLQSYANEAAYREQNAAQANARAALDIVSDDLRGAKRVKDANGILLPDAAVTLGARTAADPLYFDVVDDSDATRRVYYWLDSGSLMRRIDNGTAAVAARNITTFNATKPYAPDYNVVRIVITSQFGSTPTSSVTVRSDVTIRNNLVL